MAWTQADIDALKKAIARGALSVTYTNGGVSQSVSYRSLDEMTRILRMMEADVAGAPGRVSFVGFDRG